MSVIHLKNQKICIPFQTMKILKAIDRPLARFRWYRRLTKKLFGWKWRQSVYPPEKEDK
ncbi:MAG: hypothetical protein ACE5JB_10500 [bacterium]